MNQVEKLEKSPKNNDLKLISKALLHKHYDELLFMARRRRQRLGCAATLETSDVLHESYFKLSGNTAWGSKEHFFATMTLAMRNVIVDYARKKSSQRRGSNAQKAALDDVELELAEYKETPEQIVEISDLLEKLELKEPRWVKVVNARYFSGMTEAETANYMGLSDRTVRREWKAARSWLAEMVAH